MVGGGLAIAQAPGNYVCGTDAKVGDAAFLKALESPEKARKAIDAGKAAIFADNDTGPEPTLPRKLSRVPTAASFCACMTESATQCGEKNCREKQRAQKLFHSSKLGDSVRGKRWW